MPNYVGRGNFIQNKPKQNKTIVTAFTFRVRGGKNDVYILLGKEIVMGGERKA